MLQVNNKVEKVLLAKVATGDESAFRILFDTYANKIYSFALRLTRSQFLAEEVTQDVFLQIWLKRNELAEIHFFYAYLKAASRNMAINYLKRLAQERLILSNMNSGSPETADHSMEQSIDSQECQQILNRAIHQLPPQQRKAYLLSRQEGLKYKEIASRMQISRHTVNEYMKKALNNLRNQLHSQLDLIILPVLWIIFRK